MDVTTTLEPNAHSFFVPVLGKAIHVCLKCAKPGFIRKFRSYASLREHMSERHQQEVRLAPPEPKKVAR